MQDKRGREKAIFLIYILLFVILAVSMVFIQAIYRRGSDYSNPPDELFRFLVPKYIYENGKLPTGFEEEVRISGYGYSYALYNVLPYIIQAFFMKIAGIFTKSGDVLYYIARLSNVLNGVITAFLVYTISKRLFFDERLQWLFSFGIMFLPEHLFVHTYVNTDSMAVLSTAVIIYAWILSMDEGFSYKTDILLSIGIIICALSYYNAYGFIMCSVLFFVSSFIRRKDEVEKYDFKGMIKHGVFITGFVLIGAGWWFVREYFVLSGDILGLKTRYELAVKYALPEVNPLSKNTYRDRGLSVIDMLIADEYINNVFVSFVAVFASMKAVGNVWIYRIYKLLYGCAFLGLFIPSKGNKDKEALELKKIIFEICLILCIISVILVLIIYSYTSDYQSQGRYIIPAVIPIYYFLTKGIEKYFSLKIINERIKTVAAVLVVTILVVICAYMIYGVTLPYAMADLKV